MITIVRAMFESQSAEALLCLLLHGRLAHYFIPPPLLTKLQYNRSNLFMQLILIQSISKFVDMGGRGGGGKATTKELHIMLCC